MSEANTHDDPVLARLRAALEEVDPVPADVTEFGRSAIDWREIDAELADLGFDSIEEDLPAGVRSTATTRMVSFQVGQWMLDVEYDETRGRLLGHITPEVPYSIDLHTPGTFFTTVSDERGRFSAEGVGHGPLGMVLRLSGGPVIKTQWVVI